MRSKTIYKDLESSNPLRLTSKQESKSPFSKEAKSILKFQTRFNLIINYKIYIFYYDLKRHQKNHGQGDLSPALKKYLDSDGQVQEARQKANGLEVLQN